MPKSGLILLSFYFIFSSATCQSTVGKYLISNKHDLCSSTSLDSSLSNFKVFFVGEYHNLPGNSKSKIAMIKYLNKTHGLKKVVLETSCSYEDYINAYVLRGNMDSLKLFGPYLGRLNSFGKVMKFLCDYNQDLPQNDKISIRCIDTESDYKYAIKVFLSEFRNCHLPSEIKLRIDRLRNVNVENKDSTSISHVKSMIDSIYSHMKTNRKSYELCLKGKYYKCERLIEGAHIGVGNHLEKSFSSNTLEQHRKDSIYAAAREKFMFKNYINIIQEFPNEIFFGQFGKAHCSLSPGTKEAHSSSWTSLASMLNSLDSPVQGRVCSIDRVGRNGMKWLVEDYGSKVGKQDKKAINSKCKHTLYKLDVAGSPFLDIAPLFQYKLRYNWRGKSCIDNCGS
jgi:hypothetical protein